MFLLIFLVDYVHAGSDDIYYCYYLLYQLDTGRCTQKAQPVQGVYLYKPKGDLETNDLHKFQYDISVILLCFIQSRCMSCM